MHPRNRRVCIEEEEEEKTENGASKGGSGKVTILLPLNGGKCHLKAKVLKRWPCRWKEPRGGR